MRIIFPLTLLPYIFLLLKMLHYKSKSKKFVIYFSACQNNYEYKQLDEINLVVCETGPAVVDAAVLAASNKSALLLAVNTYKLDVAQNESDIWVRHGCHRHDRL